MKASTTTRCALVECWWALLQGVVIAPLCHSVGSEMTGICGLLAAVTSGDPFWSCSCLYLNIPLAGGNSVCQ